VALRVRVRERPPDEHLVVGEVQAVDEHARPERDLLAVGEEVARVAVEHHPPDRTQRGGLLGPGLRVVERVEVELRVLVVAHGLDLELPLPEVARLDRVVEVRRARAVGLGLDLRCVGGRAG